MENAIIILLLAAIAAGSIWYLVRAKKRGDTCVGCPHAKQCQHNGTCQKEPRE